MQELIEEAVAQEAKYGDTINKLGFQEDKKWLKLTQVCMGDYQKNIWTELMDFYANLVFFF